MSVDRRIPRLLAGRDRLSRIEKDAILDSVLAGVAPRRRTNRWWLAAVPAVAATIALVLIAPWRSSAPTSELTARGGSEPVAAFQPTCVGGCEAGHKISFDLHGTTGYRYFAAFGKHADGTVLWYFPAAATDASLDLTAQPRDGVLDRGIVLGPEHAPGRYRVYGVFSRVPLTREAIRAAFDDALPSAGPGTAVLVSELVVR